MENIYQLFLPCCHQYRCWECKEKCSVFSTFRLPEPLFLLILNTALKSQAGLLMIQGVPQKDIDDAFPIVFLSLYTSRLKCLKSKK